MPTALDILAMTPTELRAHTQARLAAKAAEERRRTTPPARAEVAVPHSAAFEAGLQDAADRYGAQW